MTPITTQADLNALYLDAWDEQYNSKRHWARVAKLGHLAHEAERDPSLFADNAEKAQAYETAFQAKSAELAR